MCVTAVFYGATRGMDLLDPIVDNLIGVLGGAAGSLEEAGRLSQREMHAALAQFDTWRRSEAATVWYSLRLAEGTKSARRRQEKRP